MLMRFIGAGAIGFIAICDFCLPPGEAAVRAEAAVAAPLAETQKARSKTITFQVDGMTCGGCAISARKVLRKLDGVEKAEVVYAKRLAIVTYNPARVTPQQMIKALKDKLGYRATRVQEKKS